MSIQRLRAIIQRYGNLGVLFVAIYLIIRQQWQQRRVHFIVFGSMSTLFLCGMTGWLLHQSPAPTKPHIADSTVKPLLSTNPELERALKEADALLAEHQDVPPIIGALPEQTSILGGVIDAYNAIIEEYGEIDRAYIGLGECKLKVGNYEAAANAWSHALKIAPHNADAKEKLVNLRSLIEAKRMIESHITKGHKVTRIRLFSPDTKNVYWVVLHGRVLKSEGDSPGYSHK